MSSGGDEPDTDPTEFERAQAEIGARDHNIYQQYYVPAEEDLRDSFEATTTRRAESRGQSAVDIQLAASDALNGIGFSADPNQTAMGLHRANLSLSEARARGVGTADQAVQTAEISGGLKMASFGRDLDDSTNLAQIRRGQADTRSAIQDMELEIARDQQLAASIGQGLGAYAGYSGVFRNRSGANTPNTVQPPDDGYRG